MKILITGGAGFIGCNLARAAIASGHAVRVLDDFSTGHIENLQGLDLDLRTGSILDDETLRSAIQGVDSVVHLAALGSVPRSIEKPFATHETNATGTLHVLIAARDAGVEHISVASSSSVYGSNPAMPKGEREWVRAMSPYAVSKLATEQYALTCQDAYGMSTIAFRFFNVYGPWQRPGHAYAAVVPIFMDALISGESLPINGDGSNSRDFTFVETVCDVLLKAAERKVSHAEPINLAYGTNTSLLNLAERMGEVSGREAKVTHKPPRPGDVKHSQAKNASLLGLFPEVEPVPLDEGLRMAYEWFLKEYK